MENEISPGSFTILSSPDAVRSTQIIGIRNDPKDPVSIVYMGESTLADQWFEPAIITNLSQKGNVYMMVNDEDLAGGYYDSIIKP